MEAKQTCFDVERDRKSLNSSSESSCNLLDVLSRVPGLLLRFLWLVNCGVFADIFKKRETLWVHLTLCKNLSGCAAFLLSFVSLNAVVLVPIRDFVPQPHIVCYRSMSGVSF